MNRCALVFVGSLLLAFPTCHFAADYDSDFRYNVTHGKNVDYKKKKYKKINKRKYEYDRVGSGDWGVLCAWYIHWKLWSTTRGLERHFRCLPMKELHLLSFGISEWGKRGISA